MLDTVMPIRRFGIPEVMMYYQSWSAIAIVDTRMNNQFLALNPVQVACSQCFLPYQEDQSWNLACVLSFAVKLNVDENLESQDCKTSININTASLDLSCIL